MKPRLTRFLFSLLLVSLMPAFPVDAAAQTKGRRNEPPSRSSPIAGQPYERFSTHDRFGREITFYLSEAPAGRGPLPLVLYIEGSGCGSRFEERDGKILPAVGPTPPTRSFSLARGKDRLRLERLRGLRPDNPPSVRGELRV